MNVGIYGDSYASANSPQAVKWFELLAEKLENDKTPAPKNSLFSFFKKEKKTEKNFFGEKINLNIYSWAGSSFYYTYKKFLENYKSNDLNIVLVTNPGRYTKKLDLTKSKFKQVITTEPHIDQVIQTFAPELTPVDKNKLIFLKGWFKSQDYEYVTDMHELMIQKMESLDESTIFYPCFSDSLSQERSKKYGLDVQTEHMHVYFHRQMELLNLPMTDFAAPETENLCGHLGPEFNEFFANVLYKRIKTGKWDHSGMLDVKLNKSLLFYYQQRMPNEQTPVQP